MAYNAPAARRRLCRRCRSIITCRSWLPVPARHHPHEACPLLPYSRVFQPGLSEHRGTCSGGCDTHPLRNLGHARCHGYPQPSRTGYLTASRCACSPVGHLSMSRPTPAPRAVLIRQTPVGGTYATGRLFSLGRHASLCRHPACTGADVHKYTRAHTLIDCTPNYLGAVRVCGQINWFCRVCSARVCPFVGACECACLPVPGSCMCHADVGFYMRSEEGRRERPLLVPRLSPVLDSLQCQKYAPFSV